jgi:hypothetical protein
MPSEIDQTWGEAAYDAIDLIFYLPFHDQGRDHEFGAQTNQAILTLIGLGVTPGCPSEHKALADPRILLADGVWGDAAKEALARLAALDLSSFAPEDDQDDGPDADQSSGSAA